MGEDSVGRVEDVDVADVKVDIVKKRERIAKQEFIIVLYVPGVV